LFAYYLRAFYELSRLKALLHIQKIASIKTASLRKTASFWLCIDGCASSWSVVRLHKNPEMDDSSESSANIRVPPEKVHEVSGKLIQKPNPFLISNNTTEVQPAVLQWRTESFLSVCNSVAMDRYMKICIDV